MDYRILVDVYESLQATAKRLEKTSIIGDFLSSVPEKDLPRVILLLQGKVFPSYDERKIGVAAKLIVKALHSSFGTSVHDIEKTWKQLGDLGDVAAELTSKKKQQTLTSRTLSVEKVFQNLQKLASTEGKGSVDQKLGLIAELLTSASPLEAKYITRTILEDLRVGVADGVLRDSIVWAFFQGSAYSDGDIVDRDTYNRYVSAVQDAYDVSNDFARVAIAAKSQGLEGLSGIGLMIGVPLKVMLAPKVKSVEEGFERCGSPAAIEYKYDGFRMQAHKAGSAIHLFTRRLEDVTAQFPEVVRYIKEFVKGDSFILDAEAVGFDPSTGNYRPFQHISQRIRRKYGIDAMAKELPVELNVFDIIASEGKSTISLPFKERRGLIEGMVSEQPRKIVLAKSIITSKVSEAQELFEEALSVGNEGVMMKKLDAPYKPGARVGYMVKLKPTTDPLDLVIVAAEWGEGKRSKWITSYVLACRDEDGNLLEIGKVSTGLKEKPEEGLSFKEVSDMIHPLITKEEGRHVIVRPEIVVSVGYDEIQKSPNYSSGYALRFPRFKAVRYDRTTDDIASLEEIEHLFEEQKK